MSAEAGHSSLFAGASEAAVAEEAAWLRALLAAEVDTAVGPENLRTPSAVAGVLAQLLAAGTLVRGPDQALRLARDSDGARCACRLSAGLSCVSDALVTTVADMSNFYVFAGPLWRSPGARLSLRTVRRAPEETHFTKLAIQQARHAVTAADVGIDKDRQ